jgi:hypothetical protein
MLRHCVLLRARAPSPFQNLLSFPRSFQAVKRLAVGFFIPSSELKVFLNPAPNLVIKTKPFSKAFYLKIVVKFHAATMKNRKLLRKLLLQSSL